MQPIQNEKKIPSPISHPSQTQKIGVTTDAYYKQLLPQFVDGFQTNNKRNEMKKLIWKYGVVGTLKARKLIIFGIVQLLLPHNNFWTKADKHWAKEFKTLKTK